MAIKTNMNDLADLLMDDSYDDYYYEESSDIQYVSNANAVDDDIDM